MLNGLMTQLMRIEPGKDVEEAHMRNRKLIAEWAMEHGKTDNVVEMVNIDGKTFVKINDYNRLRDAFGELEKYAVKIDPALHKEVLDRYAHLDIAPYKGFVNPVYYGVDAQGNPTADEEKIADIRVEYTEDYLPQMLRYSRDYSPLTK